MDPAGLEVTWTGSVSSISATWGIGGQLIRFKLESECKCNVKYRISGFASLLTMGAGLKLMGVGEFFSDVAGSHGGTTMVDEYVDCPDPYAANGFAAATGINSIVGAGASFLSTLHLGRLRTWGYASKAFGFDMSIRARFLSQAEVR